MSARPVHDFHAVEEDYVLAGETVRSVEQFITRGVSADVLAGDRARVFTAPYERRWAVVLHAPVSRDGVLGLPISALEFETDPRDALGPSHEWLLWARQADDPSAFEDVMFQPEFAQFPSIRREMAMNPYAPPFVLEVLAEDADIEVRRAVSERDGLPESVRVILARSSTIRAAVCVEPVPLVPAVNPMDGF